MSCYVNGKLKTRHAITLCCSEMFTLHLQTKNPPLVLIIFTPLMSDVGTEDIFHRNQKLSVILFYYFIIRKALIQYFMVLTSWWDYFQISRITRATGLSCIKQNETFYPSCCSIVYSPHGTCWYTISNPLAESVATLTRTLGEASSANTSSAKGVV